MQTAFSLSKQDYLEMSYTLSSWDLTPQQLGDVEMLLTGAFAPLRGFLNQADYDSVLSSMRLASGALWPLPITLDVPATFAETLHIGEKIALRDAEGVMLALMSIDSLWTPDKVHEAECVYGTTDIQHAGVSALLNQSDCVYLGGTLEKVELPTHFDYRQYRQTPEELKTLFKKLGWQRIVAYHSHEPMHRLQQNITFKIAQRLEANLLLHPTVGSSTASVFDHFLRVRCYTHLLAKYPEQTTLLSLINLSMRMAGPREALCHALIRKNYGCTHFIIDDSYASPNNNQQGEAFYTPQAALALAKHYEDEIGINIISAGEHVYAQERAEYVPISALTGNETALSISQPEFLRRLQKDLIIPEWFSYPEILSEIRNAYPPRHLQGFTVFFTGLSGSGKSTVANALRVKLLEKGGRPVTLLDGDVVRKNLSSELSFSKEHRDLNILRIGYVASEITKNGGIAICAPIAPYSAIRKQVRESIEAIGGYIEVHVSTPLAECERRDRKGLYAKARAGLIQHFTGINDPYEAPVNPDLRLDTSDITPDACAHQVLLSLEKLGFFKA